MKKLVLSLLFLCTPAFVLTQEKKEEYRAPDVATAQSVGVFFEQLIESVSTAAKAGKKDILVVILLEMLMKEPKGFKQELMALTPMLENATQEQQQEILVAFLTKLYYTFDLADEKIPAYIQELQTMGATIVGISVADSTVSSQMIQRLHHHNIHFETSAIINEDLKLASKDNSAWYTNGILFSQDLNLALPFVETLLKDAQFKPDARFYLGPVTEKPAQ